MNFKTIDQSLNYFHNLLTLKLLIKDYSLHFIQIMSNCHIMEIGIFFEKVKKIKNKNYYD